jgi:DNA-binding CsgD family transcriptional regulator
LIVGREQERQLLRGLLDGMFERRGSLLLIGGEAGIGKTTLTTLLANQAEERGAFVLIGHCDDLMTTPPYGPWRDVFRGAEADERLPPLPEPLRQAGQLAAFPDQPALFEHIHDYLADCAAVSPLLIVLEDIHWADHASLGLLHAVSRRLTHLQAMVVATYRGELGRDDPLFRLLPRLVREAPTRRIDLRRLDRTATAELVAWRYGLSQPDQERLVSALQRLAEGNPFFTNELLRALEYDGLLVQTEDGWRLGDLDQMQIPPLVQQVIEVRLAQLDAASRSLLDVASVIGQETPLELWLAASGASETQLAGVIRDAAAAHLLRQAPGGTSFRFVHALVRETVYNGIVLPERRAWHRRVAQALAGRSGSEPDSVAHHFLQAGDLPEALDWLIRAGDGALRLYAPETAAARFSAAETVAAQLGHPFPAASRQAAARAYEMVGDFERAQAGYRTVLDQAGASGDQSLVWQALSGLGRIWSERDYDQTRDYFTSALRLAEQLNEPALLGHSLNQVGNWHANAEEPAEAVRCHQEALAIFGRLGDRAGEAETLDLLGMTYYLAGDFQASAAAYRRAIPLLTAADNRQALINALATLGLTGGSHESETAVPTSGVDEAGERAVSLARQTGWRASEAYALHCLGDVVATRGDIGRGLVLVQQSRAIAEQIGHPQWLAATADILGSFYRDLLDPATAEQWARQALLTAQPLNSAYWLRMTTTGLVAALILQERLEEAASQLEEVFPSAAEPRSMAQCLCCLRRAELALAGGDPERSLDIIGSLEAAVPGGQPTGAVPKLAYRRGEALAQLSRWREAGVALERSRDAAIQFRVPSLRWQAARLLATVYQRLDNEGAAVQALAEAREAVEAIAASLEEGPARRAFVERALASLPAHRDAPRREERPYGLTARELDVLRLVAAGLTDREIAERLFISPRTAMNHVGNILAKLDVNSRAAAAAISAREGLT